MMEFNYKLEDFNDIAPYEELEKIEDPFKKQIAENQLEAYAKKLGFKAFKKTLAGYRKSLKAPFEDATDYKVSDFQGQEFELKLKQWNADETGIWRMGNNGTRELACFHPIYPIQRFEDIETSKEKYKIEYRRGQSRKKKTKIVDSEVLCNANKIVSLASDGVSVTSETSRNLVSYFNEIINENYDDIPLVPSISHLGWCTEGFVPYIEGVEFDGDARYTKIFQSIRSKGSFDAWVDEISKCREYNLTARIVIAASFASSLIEPLHALPFIVHLWGGSGTGKTVAQMAAASVWGDPVKGNGIFATVKGSDSGFEFKANFLRSIPMLLDETQLLEKGKNGTPKFKIYELAEGVGKTRGTVNLGLAEVPIWNNCFITSGETPIVGEQDGAGAMNRVIEVACAADTKIIENGPYTANFFTKNYGFGGKMFIYRLNQDENMEKAAEIYEKHRAACIDDKATEKQAMAAAVILTADELITEWFFDGDPLTAKDMSEFLKSAEAVSSEIRGYEYMCGWVAANHNRFGAVENGECYGEIEETGSNAVVYIIRSVFDRACGEAGINPKALLAYLRHKNLIKTRGDAKGYCVNRRMFPGMPVTQCVAMCIMGEDDRDHDTYEDIDF